ncbi:hypothetical protein [Herbaspirillum seropedicae]|uniref:hypothetical protein n=1 Tax=Herbaspirillum seropedicae TaxID=964 RepID=UPI0012E9B97C|nr:hypothetical protein [Herbaspirillum seropedicae]
MLDLSGKNKREWLAMVWSGTAVTGPQRIPQQSKHRRPWGAMAKGLGRQCRQKDGGNARARIAQDCSLRKVEKFVSCQY